MREIKVVLWGIGDIATRLIDRIPSNWKVLGAVDISKDKISTYLRKLNLRIKSPHEIDLEALKPDLVIHMSGTFLSDFKDDLVRFIKSGAHVVTTAETMGWPWYRYPDLADEIDEMAKEKGVTILPTGVNPGFIFDALPLLLTFPSLQVTAIRVKRKINAYQRRRAFVKKYGIGLTEEEFFRGLEEGWITGHVGYEESILALGDALGWRFIELRSQQVPIVWERKVIGLRGEALGRTEDGKEITLTLLAMNESEDEIIIEGEPSYHWKALGGVHGDIATVSGIINSAQLLTSQTLPHGIVKLRDLIKLRFSRGNDKV